MPFAQSMSFIFLKKYKIIPNLLDFALDISKELRKIVVIARVAQSVEQRTENPCVAGSIPASGTITEHIW